MNDSKLKSVALYLIRIYTNKIVTQRLVQAQ